jgi:intracellular sulfur oxidation DsrE/DsrF family protein
MSSIVRSIFLAVVVAFVAAGGAQAEAGKPHRVVIQVDQNDAEVMNLALNNAKNVLETYRAKNEDAVVEIVAYGPGLHMLRDDTSPVKDRIKQLAELSFPSTLKFSACNNSKQGMEKREGHSITIIPQATLVPAGVVRIMELEEQGYSYVKP